MSVSLRVFRDPEFDAIELMAPDFDADYFWLWRDEDAENRLDLSREQARELRDALNELLPPIPKTDRSST